MPDFASSSQDKSRRTTAKPDTRRNAAVKARS